MNLTQVASFLLIALSGAQLFAANPATQPVPRNERMALHDSFNAIARAGKVDLVFLGDSITQRWGTAGKKIWDERFAPLGAVNFGIGGDRTQHVLWRVQNGNFAGITPRVVVLLIGTNNSSGSATPEQIAEGIKAIIKEIQKLSPTTKILLLGVFPRAEKSDSPARLKVLAINEIIAGFDDGERVVFLDIGKNFLQPDGTLTSEIMPDLLHLSPAGYQIWADAIHEKLVALLK